MPFISPANFALRSRRTLVCAFLISVFTLIGVAVSARAWIRRDKTGSPSTVDKVSTKSFLVSSPSSQRQRIEGEIVSLSPNGFEPKQITRPAGPFLLVVGNESHLPSVTLLLVGDVGLPLRNVLVAREKRFWSDIVDLPPGNYKLTEAAHPGWVCNITIR